MQITAAEEQPPVAVIAAPGAALAGEVVTLDGNGSTASNPIVNYTWNFGDSSQGSGPVVEHVYNKAGSYTVKLTVTDNTGLKGESTWGITISEQEQNPPLAVLAGPTQALVGQDVTFDGSESTPGSSSIVNYAWDFGNGKTASGKNETNVTTQYTAAGTYQVTLTVTDENGLSNSASASINISASLENTTWSLVSTQPDLNITAVFSQGQVSGNSGCNDYSGAYATDAPDAEQWQPDRSGTHGHEEGVRGRCHGRRERLSDITGVCDRLQHFGRYAYVELPLRCLDLPGAESSAPLTKKVIAEPAPSPVSRFC